MVILIKVKVTTTMETLFPCYNLIIWRENYGEKHVKQRRSDLMGWGGGTSGHVPHFNFWTKQDPIVSVLNIKDIAFYGCLKIIRTRNFTIFTLHATIFEQLTGAFHFFKLHRRNKALHIGPSEKFLIVEHPKQDHNEGEFKR